MSDGISKETFQGYSTDSKLDTLFDYVLDIHKWQHDQPVICEKRLRKLENRKWINTGASGGGGIIGGALTWLAIKFGVFQ